MPSLPRSAEHGADSEALRAVLRREKLATRMALDAATRGELSTRIEGHLTALLAALPPQTLAFCAPVRGEFDARPLASLLLQRDWQAAMPVVVETAAPMRFRRWTPTCAMDVDRYGIPIPADGAELIPAVVLLPLVAFDAQGFRLGYGGGYFDRTLAAMVPHPLAIGVGFELARVADIAPQAHDIPLAAAVTEAGVEYFTRR